MFLAQACKWGLLLALTQGYINLGILIMELLDQLEHQVSKLLERIDGLKAQHASVAELQARCQELEADKKSLADALELERSNNQAVLKRLDLLLAKLKLAKEIGQ